MSLKSSSTVGLISIGILSIVGGCGGSTSSEFGANGTGASGPSGTGGGGIIGANGSGGGGLISTGSGGGSGTISADAACATQAQDGQAIATDLFFMVDKSGSMFCPIGPAGQTCGLGGQGSTNPPNNRMPPDRWSALSDAMNSFVANPASAGTGVGMGFFPLMARGGNNNVLCTVPSYAVPTPAIAALPGSAMAITQAIAMNMPAGGTPTTPALEGALQYARARMTMDPTRAVAVVLASDGLPNGCNSTIANAAAAAAAAFAATPPIKTYVLGVGPALANLNQIAVAGGTMQAYIVDTGANVAQQFADALKAIATPITCDYAIPPAAPGKPLDLNTVNVQTRIGTGGTPTLIGQVANIGACGSGEGWFYDNPNAPTKISLCSTTCNPLLNTPGSGLQVVIGCGTITR